LQVLKGLGISAILIDTEIVDDYHI